MADDLKKPTALTRQPKLGDEVMYNHDGQQLVGWISYLHETGNANLCVLELTGAPRAAPNVPQGTGHHTWSWRD